MKSFSRLITTLFIIFISFNISEASFFDDGDLDGSDLAVFVNAFRSEYGSPNYNADADFGSDNDVDIMDLIIFTSLFGKTEDSYKYEITDIGISGKDTYAEALNDLGQAVGYTKDSSGISHAFIWDKTNGLRELETLGGNNSRAKDINNSGQVVGEEYLPFVGFIWEDGSGIQPLCELYEPRNIQSCSADAINENGAVVGNIQYGMDTVPVLWESINEVNFLGFPPEQYYTFSNPHDINEVGQVVGILHDVGWMYSTGFIWDFTNGSRVLFTPVGERESANSINNYGIVVGYSSSEYVFKLPFIWNETGGMEALKTLGVESSAMAINDAGQIVGYYSEFAYGDKHACIWRGNQAIDLNDLIPANSEWVLRVATDINEHGQIVGYGEFNGESHAFLLDP